MALDGTARGDSPCSDAAVSESLKRSRCKLCQTPISGRAGAADLFCCSGCERVFDVLGRLDEGARAAYVETARRLGIIPGSPEETALAERSAKPLLVHRFPSQSKAFYMEPDPERPELSLSVDCLAPEGYGEIIGGGQRIADYDLLLERVNEHNLPEAAFRWYLDLRRYGSTPHSGFGLGIERTVAWICGLDNIKDAIPFPRTMLRWNP